MGHLPWLREPYISGIDRDGCRGSCSGLSARNTRQADFILFLSCSSIPNQPDISNVAVQAAIKLAQPELEKAFVAQAPIAPSSRGRLPIVDCLPGGAFNPSSKVGKSLSYDSKGNVVLSPGDYIIPVMT
jgi:hypothetical protein